MLFADEHLLIRTVTVLNLHVTCFIVDAAPVFNSSCTQDQGQNAGTANAQSCVSMGEWAQREAVTHGGNLRF
jgi:hypothetical protein